MANKNRTRDDDDTQRVDLAAHIARTVEPADVVDDRPTPVPEAPLAVGKVPAPPQEPQVTARRHLTPRSTDPVIGAFLHMEQLSGKVRKLTRAEWDTELAAFRQAPR